MKSIENFLEVLRTVKSQYGNAVLLPLKENRGIHPVGYMGQLEFPEGLFYKYPDMDDYIYFLDKEELAYQYNKSSLGVMKQNSSTKSSMYNYAMICYHLDKDILFNKFRSDLLENGSKEDLRIFDSVIEHYTVLQNWLEFNQLG